MSKFYTFRQRPLCGNEVTHKVGRFCNIVSIEANTRSELEKRAKSLEMNLAFRCQDCGSLWEEVEGDFSCPKNNLKLLAEVTEDRPMYIHYLYNPVQKLWLVVTCEPVEP